MADLDTYNDEPRQYDGKQAFSNARDTGENYGYGYQIHSELATSPAKHHDARYLSFFRDRSETDTTRTRRPRLPSAA